MEVLLATSVVEEIMGVQTESLADVDGRLTIFLEEAPDRQPYICKNEDDALRWVHESLEISREGFLAEDALFGRFPQLIDELGAKLAISLRKEGESEVREKLSRKQGRYFKASYTFLGDELVSDMLAPPLELSEDEAKQWINDAKNDKASTLKLTTAGEALFSELIAYDPLALTGDLDITFDRCAAVEDGRVVIVGSMCFDNLREALIRGEKRGEISEQNVEDILNSEYIVETCVYRTENTATMRINAFTGNGEAKCGCNVPLTRDEQAQLIKLTQGLYKAVDRETVDKPKKSSDKEIGD